MATKREGLLSREMIAFLRETDDEKRKYKSTYFKRSVKDGILGICHLTLLAKHLPEKRRSQIFNHYALKPLITAILQCEESLDLERQRIAVMLAKKGLLAYLEHVKSQSTANYMLTLNEMSGPLNFLRAAEADLESLEKKRQKKEAEEKKVAQEKRRRRLKNKDSS